MSTSPSSLSICAIIGARNERHYLRLLLPRLAAQRIDVVIIDNDSDDGSDRLYEELAGRPVIGVERSPYQGFLSMTALLERKREVARRLPHDWVIHHDSDEVLEHRSDGLTLRQAIEEADVAGYNALNFEEFVFLPEPGQDYTSADYYAEMRRYYFFCPKENRLNRARKRADDLDDVAAGGHRLTGPSVRISPVNHVLRHYIALSEAAIIKKYSQRVFAEDELAKGWHRNRLGLTPARLRIPRVHSNLLMLPDEPPRGFNRDHPTKEHYWAWPTEVSWAARFKGWFSS
jgi:glycosyltransferase involved in cell wall biosynthesis